MAGNKELLGMWIQKNEGAKFWLQVMTDLKNRGVEDIFIACVDGLKGFPEAINSLYPKTEIQLCIVHQIRNSIKYVSTKNQKEFLKDLKTIYKAPTQDVALTNLGALDEKWGKTYPMVVNSWIKNFENLSQYFKYADPIRKMIYTTNIIEGYNRQLRKVTKNRAIFPTDDSLIKLMYLATKDVVKKWKAPSWNWALTIGQLSLIFPDRLKLSLR